MAKNKGYKEEGSDLLGFLVALVTMFALVGLIVKLLAEKQLIDLEELKKLALKGESKQKSRSRKPSKRVVKKRDTSQTKLSSVVSKRALDLLKIMEKDHAYTQKELSEISGIPYRSVRRYVDALHRAGLVYIKGKARATRIYKA